MEARDFVGGAGRGRSSRGEGVSARVTPYTEVTVTPRTRECEGSSHTYHLQENMAHQYLFTKESGDINKYIN